MGRKRTVKRNYDNEGKLISKECSCCHKIKTVSEFGKDRSKIDGLKLKCKECNKQYYKDNAEYYKQYNKQYQKDNAEYYKEHHKKYYKDNAESIKEYNKQYYKDNVEHYKEYRREHYKDNAEYFKQYQKDNAEYYKEYLKEYYTKKAQESLQQIKIEVEANPEKYDYTEGKDIYGIIYLVHNIKSDKYYIGQTTIGFDNRYPKGWLHEHSYKNAVREDLDIYGENSFEYDKLFKVAYSQHELDKLEAYYIDYYNSFENGYNEKRGNIFTDRGKEK